MPFLFLRVLPPHSPVLLGNWTETPKAAPVLEPYQVSDLETGYLALGWLFFLFLEKEELALNLLFSSLLCSIENSPWIYPGADPLLYFSQHNLVWELLGLDPKRNGLSLFPRYPATLRWCPGPQGLQTWPLALTTISLPQTVFFCLPFLLPSSLVFTFYHNHLSSSSIQPKPRGNLVLPEGYCKDLVAFSLSQSLFLLKSVSSLCSPSPEEKGPNSLYLYSSSS